MSTKLTLRLSPGTTIEVEQDRAHGIMIAVSKIKQGEVIVSIDEGEAFRLGKFLLSLVGK